MAQQKIFQPAILSLSKPIESANDGATRLKPLDKCPSNNYPLMGHYCGAKNASRGKLNLTKFAARVLSRGLQTFRCNVALVLFCFFSVQFKGKFINLLDLLSSVTRLAKNQLWQKFKSFAKKLRAYLIVSKWLNIVWPFYVIENFFSVRSISQYFER